jgi:hypothetical protein
MTLQSADYLEAGDVHFGGAEQHTHQRIPSSAVMAAVVEANLYLRDLRVQFRRIGFNVYESLGQRNISGFVGEVFSHLLSRHTPGLVPNPHPDGRPDLIDVSSPLAQEHLRIRCYATGKSTQTVPIKAQFTPFKFGGVEVKATIGDLPHGVDPPAVGTPRHRHIRALTYWGHHRNCCNLLGVYYDYFVTRDSAPQVAAVFHARLLESDWNAVSLGRAGSKKTSNTSLNASGRSKLSSGLVVSLRAAEIRKALLRCGTSQPQFP